MSLKHLSRICLIFFLFIIVNYFYIGVTTIPSEGDSLNYHLPIAHAYLDGSIFTPEKIDGVPFLKYSPGASEGLLSVFLLLNIPPNLFNVFGVVVFFLSLFYLARKFTLSKDYSIIFASSVATLNGIVRWIDTQKIDIFLASFFVLALALLQKPEKKLSYFVKLGIVIGMLIGSKYTGILYAIVLFALYGKRLIPFISPKNIYFFSLLIFIFGASWYLRNFISTGNPLYPQGFLIFKDAGFTILTSQVWRVITSGWYGFTGTINAVISEYMIWTAAVPLITFYLIKTRLRVSKNILLLSILGFLNLCIYLFLPSDYKDYIMISVIRYSYVAFIPFVLLCFLIAKKYKKEELIGVGVVANMFFVSFPMGYNPKLLFIYIPLVLIIYFKYKS